MKSCGRGGENRRPRIPNEAVFRSWCPLCLCGDLLCPGPAAEAEKIGNTGLRIQLLFVLCVLRASVVICFFLVLWQRRGKSAAQDSDCSFFSLFCFSLPLC